MAKPFLKWVGGKTQLLAQFEQLLPCKLRQMEKFTYVEPFVGGGAMLFYMLQNYPNISHAYINDINHKLITAYKTIKQNPKELIKLLQTLQEHYYSNNDENHRKEFFLEKREQYNNLCNDDIVQTSLMIFLNKTCFNGLYRVNSKGNFNVPFGRYVKPTICDSELIMKDSEALQKVTILCGNYSQVEAYAEKQSFVYIDPPYRPISKTSSFTSYTKENFDDEKQVQLSVFFSSLSEKGCFLMESNADCVSLNPDDRFLEDLYRQFYISRVYASRSINVDSSKRGKLSEIVIRNYSNK